MTAMASTHLHQLLPLFQFVELLDDGAQVVVLPLRPRDHLTQRRPKGLGQFLVFLLKAVIIKAAFELHKVVSMRALQYKPSTRGVWIHHVSFVLGRLAA